MRNNNKMQTIRRRMRERVPSDQTPRERFLRLAPRRVTAALNDLRKVGNLTNRNVYEPRIEDLNRIESALDKAIAQLRAKMEAAKRPRGEGVKGSNVEVFRLQA